MIATSRMRLGMRTLIILLLILFLLGGARQILGADIGDSPAIYPASLATLTESHASLTASDDFNKETLIQDLHTGLEQFNQSKETDANLPILAPEKMPSLQDINKALRLKAKGFHFVKSGTLSSSPNNFFVFYRHEDQKKGMELAQEVLKHLSSRTFQALPQNVTKRESLSNSASVVLSLNFLTSDKPYPIAEETAVGSTIKSPLGFHNDIRGVAMEGGSVGVHLQEYFIPLFDVLHWSAVTPEHVAELISINNAYGSDGSLYASVSESFGATMAFLTPYLKVNLDEFLQSAKRLLNALSTSQGLSKAALNQELCPSPADYYIMASGLRPTFHNISGRNMAFVSYDFDYDIYVRWLVLSQLFSLAAKPLVIEDCGWPASITDDFKRTVNEWWNQMTVIGADQKKFQQAKFLCHK